jgi:rhamnose transport system permease protein
MNGAPGAGSVRVLNPARVKELSLLAIITMIALVFSFLVDHYLSGRFFNRVTTTVAITVVLAAAQTVVILTRNIDLSVGSIVGVSAYVTGEVVADHPDLTPVLAVAMAMAIGCGLGLVNGALVAYAKVPAIVVTLGTMAIYRSWLVDHADSRSITADSLPDWVSELPQRTVVSIGDFDLRLVFFIALVVVAVLQVALARLRWGRRLYAIGSNPDAAVQAGLPQRRLVLSAFATCGALSGLAGFLFLGRFGTITTFAGQGLELDAIGAAVVGGVSIMGGAGTIVGALLGGILIDLLDLSLTRTDQVSEFWRNAILGVLILLAVLADVAIGRRFKRRWARTAEAATGRLARRQAERSEPIAATGPSTDTDTDTDTDTSTEPEPEDRVGEVSDA